MLESLALDESEAMLLLVLGSKVSHSLLRARLAATLALAWSMGASQIECLDGLDLATAHAALGVGSHLRPRVAISAAASL